MGCLIYYVLSRGSHPFGPPLKRQANIEGGDYTLHDLLGADRCVAEHLVHAMISYNYNFRSVRRRVRGGERKGMEEEGKGEGEGEGGMEEEGKGGGGRGGGREEWLN